MSHPGVDMRVGRDCFTQEGLEADINLPMDLSLYGFEDEGEPLMSQGPLAWTGETGLAETVFESPIGRDGVKSYTASPETVKMAGKDAMSTRWEPSSKPSRRRPTTERAPPRCNVESNRGGGRRDADDDYKLGHRLQRNRAAASKYRKKRRSWIRELEVSSAELVDQHASLKKEYKEVLEEAAQIKTWLMVHAVCHDPKIDMWIESEAACFVRRSHQQSPCEHRRPEMPRIGTSLCK
ncbi:bZIP transcription factor, bZIP-1 [Ophiocordyceps sinensis CO18]|uniref:BZIP transcription factor, bZIP-1 n=1 Tax=Ophiocordyceps sinensis (strain Co18 / CGMCC 3.14243) TaxID=911162 RepID=T5A6G4_OPHSC|nr:bZIP transcription factor, bZIP-1 [Ophiocordyceps sinensis CO18]